MAANNTQDVELRIRATNYSRKTTDEVVAALNQMTAAQQQQIESAKNGTTTVAQLESSYQKLENAVKALVGQNSVIKLFQSQSQAVTDLEAKLASARKAQQDFQAASAANPGKTYAAFMSERMSAYLQSEGSQAAAMKRISTEWAAFKAQAAASGSAAVEGDAKKLAAAVAAAEKELARAQARAETTKARLSEFGIAANEVAAAQQKIVTAVNGANAALERQEAAILANDANAAARKAAAEMIAQRELQIRVDNQFAAAERDLAAALQAERAAQQAANQAANDRQRERQVEVDVLFARAQREAAEELNRKTAALNAQRVAMRAAADEAERMTRAASSTARGTGPVSTPNLAGQIRDIANPADAAVRSVTGIEQAVAGLENRVRSIRGPVQGYREAMDEATRAQRSLQAVAANVDAYNRQQAAIRAAGTEFGRNQAAVRALVAELRSGNAGDDITTRLQRAQSTMQQSAQRLGALRTEARAMQAALQAAGIDTNNLTAAEQRLVQQATRAAAAVNALTRAFQQNGGAAGQSGSVIWRWFGSEGGRTTLSFMQRMRGELLGMTTSFIGLQAAVNLANKTLEAYNETQKIMNRLLVVNQGDMAKARRDYDYLQQQADRIGVSFTKVAPAFAKFAIAANLAGMNTQQTRYIFEGFATATARLGLSAIDTERVFKAIEQMFNKGKVSAEELTQQLGDAMPGALNQFAKAQGVSVAEFMKLMEQGKIGPEIMVKVAKQLQDTYGTIGNGTANLAQAQARFENATNRFLNNTAKGGFVEAYQGLLDKLTRMLNDGTADKFAQQLSTAFKAVIDVIAFLSDNIDTLKFALTALIGVQVLKWLVALPALFRLVKVEVVLLRAQITGLMAAMSATAVAGLTRALGAAGLAGVVTRLTPLLVTLRGALLAVGTAIPILGAAVLAVEGLMYALDKYDESRQGDLAKTIDASTKAMQEAGRAQVAYQKAKNTADEARAKAHYERMRQLAEDAAKRQNAAIAAARDSSGIMNDPNGTVAAALSRQSRSELPSADGGNAGGATAYPGDPDNPARRELELKKKLEADGEKIERQFRLQRLRANKGELAERLEIIKEPYDEMKKQYRESTKDDEEYNRAVAKIDAAYAKAAQLERQKYANDRAKGDENEAKRRVELAAKIKDDIAEIEADINKRKFEMDPTEPFEKRRKARVEAIGHAYDELNGRIIKQMGLDKTAAEENRKKLNGLKEQRKDLEDQNAYRDEANRLMDEYNKKQGVLRTNIDAIKAEVDAGVISQETATARINDQIKLLGPGIEQAGQSALEFAVMASNMLDPTRFAEIVASVRRGTAEFNTDRMVAVNNLNSAQQQLNDLLAEEAREIERINVQRKLGAITPEQEIDAMNAVTQKYATSIQFMAQELLKFVEIVRTAGGMSPEQLAAIEASASRVLQTSQAGIVQAQQWQTTLVQGIAQHGVTAFEQMADAIGKVITGQQGIKEGFKGMLGAAAQFFAGLMRDIAAAILKMMILKALQSMGGGIGAAASAAMGAGAQHTGGVTGFNRSGSKVLPAAVFEAAPRYHTGGIAGLQPNEVPAVLEKGEEVLTRDDPRHILNGGGGSNAEAVPQRFVLVDDRKGVAEAMASSAGEKVTLVHLKNNLPTLKQWMGAR